MASNLLINLNDLLYLRGVESNRVEFKATWDEKTTGPQIIRTLCAFANDFHNLNGGYVIIGVKEQDGKAVLPPVGVTPEEIKAIQKWLRGRCKTIDPEYQPVFSLEHIEDKLILVIWAPRSEVRPHQAPESLDKGASKKFYIRLGEETIAADASHELKIQLLQMTARVPFDDRRALNANVLDIRETKVREFLHDIGSGLIEETDSKTLYRKMRIAEAVNGYDVPKNIGLLFFSQDPQQWFSGVRIEVVQFADVHSAGDVIDDQLFAQMPIHEQLRQCLAYLENLSTRQIQKLPNRMQAVHWVNYPVQALRETLVNAVYHRSYENNPDPIKIHLYSDRMEIISYPGPVTGIELHHLNGTHPLPPVPARNGRIGELLKDLKLAEGRYSGIVKVRQAMGKNGSPPPRFDFDPDRTYFRATLPVHPEYLAILTLEDVAHLRAIGDSRGVLERLTEMSRKNPGAYGIALELCREHVAKGNIHAAEDVYHRFVAANPIQNSAALITLIASACLNNDHPQDAKKWLDRLPMLDSVEDACDAAIQEKRAGRPERAHRFFQVAGEAVMQDAKALHEFAQVKMKLADNQHKNRNAQERLLKEAHDMLQRVIQMNDVPDARRAWAWFDLGRVLGWRRAPRTDIHRAFAQANALLPDEPRFKERLQQFDKET